MKQEMNYSMYVDRYLDGVMSVDEQFWFEKELQHDADLQEEVKLQKNLQKMLAEKEVLELESELDVIYQQTYHPWKTTISSVSRNIKESLTKYTVVAASIALIIIMSVTFFSRRGSTNADIYNAHFQPAEISMIFRASAEEVNSDLRNAMTMYENKEYGKAIQLFEKVLAEDKSRIGLNLYSGISHMEIEEYAEANKSFQKVIDHQANAFIESAEWYLGLCYLKTNENEKATEVFEEIVERDGYFKKDARKIIKELQ
jgi:tetratricopeptide (TPR) repeat protein